MPDEGVERILEAVEALPEAEREELLRRLAERYGAPPPQASPLAFSATEFAGEVDYAITFDGGSQGNPGPGYGSYRLMRLVDGRSGLVRLDFGREMTSNEAEYQTLISALEGLIERIEKAGRDPTNFAVEVRGDSELVLRQVKGEWKTKDERMRALCNHARQLLGRFKGFRLVLQGRDESVRVLSH